MTTQLFFSKFLKLLVSGMIVVCTFGANVRSASAKSYLANLAGEPIRISFIEVSRYGEVQGHRWYTLQPGEEMTFSQRDGWKLTGYYIIAQGLNSGQYLTNGVSNNSVLGNVGSAIGLRLPAWVLSPALITTPMIPRIYDSPSINVYSDSIFHRNEYLAGQLMQRNVDPYNELTPSTGGIHPGVFLESNAYWLQCKYDSVKISLTGLGSDSGYIVRFWDPEIRGNIGRRLKCSGSQEGRSEPIPIERQ